MSEETVVAEPTPSQTTEPTPDPLPTPPEPTAQESEPQQTTEPKPQQTTEPQSTTEPEPAPTEVEPEPGARVVPKPSEYELPEGMPDQLRIFAHEKGFTQDQLSSALTEFNGYMQGMQQYDRQVLQEAGEAHLKNWGADSKTKLALAKQALSRNDPKGQLAQALESSGYGNHPAVLDFLYSIGKSMHEGGFITSAIPRAPGEKDAATAMYGDGITKVKGD